MAARTQSSHRRCRCMAKSEVRRAKGLQKGRWGLPAACWSYRPAACRPTLLLYRQLLLEGEPPVLDLAARHGGDRRVAVLVEAPRPQRALAEVLGREHSV